MKKSLSLILALVIVLTASVAMAAEGKVLVVDSWGFDTPKTKSVVAALSALQQRAHALVGERRQRRRVHPADFHLVSSHKNTLHKGSIADVEELYSGRSAG